MLFTDAVIAVLSLNALTFIMFGVDKFLAIINRQRISEKSLILLAMFGGSIGAITAQQLFRHKTQKFKYILWILLFLHILLGWCVWIFG